MKWLRKYSIKINLHHLTQEFYYSVWDPCSWQETPPRADFDIRLFEASGLLCSCTWIHTGEKHGWWYMKDFHEYGLEVGFLTFPHNFLVNTFYTYMQRTVVNINISSGTCLVVQWLELQASTARGTGLTPGWGSKIPCAMQYPPALQKSYPISNYVCNTSEDLGTVLVLH